MAGRCSPRVPVNTGDVGEKRHYNDVIMNAMASQITSLTIVFCNGLFRLRSKKKQSPTSLAFVCVCGGGGGGGRRGDSRFTGDRWIFPEQRVSNAEKFPFDDVIMRTYLLNSRGMWQFVFIKLHTRIRHTLNNKNTGSCEYNAIHAMNGFGNFICKMADIFSRPHFV